MYGLDKEVAGGPVSGTLKLSLDGSAERIVHYRTGVGTETRQLAMRGRFVLEGARSIELYFPQPGPGVPPGFEWRIHGVLENGMLILRYPLPADGEVEERYWPFVTMHR